MKKVVVIVDPLSSGVDLAPAFQSRGVSAVAVTLKSPDWPEFGSKIRSQDFIEIISEDDSPINSLMKYDVVAIIPGTEEGIALADVLTEYFLPHFGNDPNKSYPRLHKALMQNLLREAEVPSLKTFHTASEQEAENWIIENQMQDFPLIVKPPMSSGSEMVFHIAPNQEWRTAFRYILNTPSVLSRKKSKTVVIQEQAIGSEFAVGTVSAAGNHYLAHLINYNKTTSEERRTVFDHVELVAYDKKVMGDLFEYTKSVLDALGVRWGATHTEIMLTKNGPRLIETSARMIGGPVVDFARSATGSSQADKLVEIYLDGDVSIKDYSLKKTVVPVFLRAHDDGRASNLEILDELKGLKTFFQKYLWIKNGDLVLKTVDYLTSIGIIALAGDRESIFLDYQKVRAIESKLVFVK